MGDRNPSPTKTNETDYQPCVRLPAIIDMSKKRRRGGGTTYDRRNPGEVEGIEPRWRHALGSMDMRV